MKNVLHWLGHGRGHHGGSSHRPDAGVDYDRAFKIGILLNAGFVLVEFVGGVLAGSVALVSDAGHNASDVLALGLAWGAFMLSGRPPTARHTYGLKRATILASLISAVALYFALGAIGWEAVSRLSSPPAVDSGMVMGIAGAGVIVNALTAAMFVRGRHSDLNLRGAYLHMAADAAVSLAVVVAGAVIYLTGWQRLDPVLALGVALLIFAAGYELLRESLALAMDAVPAHVHAEQVRDYLLGLTGVRDVHDLHIWGMSTTETALTAHLVVTAGVDADALLRQAGDELGQRFGIGHPTIQLERTETVEGCVFPDRMFHSVR